MNERLKHKSPKKVLSLEPRRRKRIPARIYFKISISIFLVCAVLFLAAFIFMPLPGVVPVLMYHMIGSYEDAARQGIYVNRESFAMQMAFLSIFRYRVISMDEYYEIITGRKKPRGREVVITFDDGHTSFEKEAFPILKRYSFPATIFIISDHVRKGAHDSMNLKVLEKLYVHKLITIGDHSKTHRRLPALTSEEILDELVTSKKDLEKMFNISINYLAYPTGVFDSRSMRIAKDAGYRLAFTVAHKLLEGKEEGPFCITRIKVDRICDNPLVFWYHVAGIHQMIKHQRENLRKYFP